MITVRRSQERRHIAGENQSTWMTFDGDDNTDPLRNGFGVLRVFNEETLAPGKAFILHTHQDMVIVTYVHEGMIIYNGPTESDHLMKPGDLHRVGVASGVTQCLFNATPSDDAHVFQSGFAAGVAVLEPESEKRFFTLAERKGVLKLIASPDGKEASLRIRQDVQMYSTLIHNGNHMIHELQPGRNAWLHVVKGRVLMDEYQLQAGDGAGFSGERAVSFTAQEPSEILLFDLADH